jgi:hypothetical protein
MGSARASDVILSMGNYRKFLNWLGRERLVCAVCGEELHPGDEIHRCGKLKVKYNQLGDEHGNKNCRFYHSGCFQGLYIEL